MFLADQFLPPQILFLTSFKSCLCLTKDWHHSYSNSSTLPSLEPRPPRRRGIVLRLSPPVLHPKCQGEPIGRRQRSRRKLKRKEMLPRSP